MAKKEPINITIPPGIEEGHAHFERMHHPGEIDPLKHVRWQLMTQIE